MGASLLALTKSIYYLVKKGIQRNMTRRDEKRIGAGREKSPSFAKVTNIGEQIIVIYIWKIDGKGYICLEIQASFDNDLYRLRVISHLH